MGDGDAAAEEADAETGAVLGCGDRLDRPRTLAKGIFWTTASRLSVNHTELCIERWAAAIAPMAAVMASAAAV
jgi:hypothetical protein